MVEEYGDYEQVNGAVVNRLQRELESLQAMCRGEIVTSRKTVSLHSDQTQLNGGYSRRRDAIEAAFLITLSPHEHVWTIDQQRAMAEYCLWAYQRISAVRQCVDEETLSHEKQSWACGCGAMNGVNLAECRVCGRKEA